MDNSKEVLIGAIIALVIVLVGGVAFVLANQNSGEEELVVETEEPQTTSSMPDKFWVLVCGNDTRLGTVEKDNEGYKDGNARTDTMMLVHVDQTTHRIALVTVPRDTKTTINGETKKINDAYTIGGMTLAVDQVAELTGVRADYYMNVTFVQFEKLIEGLGGVNANVPINMSLQDIVGGSQISLNAGEQDLNGAQSLVLARSRKQYADDLDACRQIQDRQIVQKVITKLANTPALIDTVVELAIANSDTNIAADDLKEVAHNFADSASELSFTSGTGPYKGGLDASAGNLWYAVRDEATWRETIKVALEHGDMNLVYGEPKVSAK